LSIVDHALRTVVSSMGVQDRLGIVIYSDKATVLRPLMHMSEANKPLAMSALNSVDASGATNLWDGLYQAMELLRSAPVPPVTADEPRYGAVLLLTDGCPNVFPPLGFAQTLRKFRDRKCGGQLPGVLHTFGFGYDLDSGLLKDLARMGGGNYSFIPDAGFVGTCFINSMAGIFTSALHDVKLSITPAPDTMIRTDTSHSIFGGMPATENLANGVFTVPIGQIHAQQPRCLALCVVPAKEGAVIAMPQIDVEYDLGSWTNRRHFTLPNAEVTHDLPPLQAYTVAMRTLLLRKLFVLLDGRAEILPQMREIVESVKQVRSKIPREVLADPLVSGIFADVDAQVTESVSRDEWYKRWGCHYLPSLFGAHAQCFCNNFKDPGLQSFGGELFATIRDDLDDIFMTLPPPKPRRVEPKRDQPKSDPHAIPRQARRDPEPSCCSVSYSMRAFNDRMMGCFHGDCKVVLGKNADGSALTKAARDVRKGDTVLCADGSVASVVCVVRTRLANDAPLVKLTKGDLVITPWHPVRLSSDSAWQFPGKLSASEASPISVSSLPSNDVYTYVLSSGHAVCVNGVYCVTFGHGFTDDVCRHDFFGTNAVIDALKKLPGFSEGVVDLTEVKLTRDATCNRVTGFSI